MTFRSFDFDNFVSTPSATQSRLFPQYEGSRDDFDIIVVGSGMGGGVLADALADGFGDRRRILVLEAGSYLFPTHVYNVCRFPNSAVANNFECKTFWQDSNHDNDQFFIGARPQLNFGGRSIFWSGLIPTIQQWELDFFPDRVRGDLAGGWLTRAGEVMNESFSMGDTAHRIVEKLRATPLAADFEIVETPRALHQPYLTREGTLRGEYFFEPTGVFNTAELLINQLGMPAGERDHNGNGLHVLLNQYVEDVRQKQDRTFELVSRHTLDGSARHFHAGTVVLAGGSIESPKLLRRSTLFRTSVPDHVKPLVGRGLTDHPTSNELTAFVTRIGDVPIPANAHAKIVFYSRGRKENGEIVFPFNVEMNVNHEYWHLRQNDPSSDPAVQRAPNERLSRLDIKFSFGNCLDDGNQVEDPDPFKYVPRIRFFNQRWTDRLAGSRFPALAGWRKNDRQIFDVLNDIARRIFEQFQNGNQNAVAADDTKFGEKGKGFGYGTVHHAIGTLRMPWKPSLTAAFDQPSVVDQDLRVAGTDHMYVCDMSVMPFSSAANPVRTLVALALRMARHFGAG
jgi:GMC oxidoreductase